MKYILWFLGAILSILVLVFILVFTSAGNAIVKPFIQTEIQKQTQLNSKLTTYSLGFNNFEIVLELNKNNTLYVKGNYSIFARSLDVEYKVDLQELKSLKPLTQIALQSSFYTDGTLKGNIKFLEIDGKSTLAKSKTRYHVELSDLQATSIIAKMKNTDLSALLYMFNQKAYANAKINLDVNFKNITPHKLDGNIQLLTKNGTFNTKVMKNDFNISIPAKTAFSMKLNALLKGDNLSYKYLLHSNLAKLTSEGQVTPSPLHLDIKYGVNIQELALLKPLSGVDVRGSLQLSGDAKGGKKSLVVNAVTDFAHSKTTLKTLLENFKPKNIYAKVKGLKIQKALYMLKQPHYSDGYIDIDANIKNADFNNLEGVISTKLYKGVLDSKYLTKLLEFNSTMPYTSFNAKTTTKLQGQLISTHMDFNSNLVDLDIKNAQLNTKKSSFKTDYKVKAHNLNKFFFMTQRHLKGSIVAHGELKKEKNLDFTMHSNIADGKIDATLHNDDFHADVNSLQTLKILDMLLYPKMFKSSLNGVLNYNIAKAKGEFKGQVSQGTFTKNGVLDLAKKYAKTDMYVEVFKGDIVAKIAKEKILATTNLQSNRSSIVAKNVKLNTLKKLIDSKIDINANGNKFIVYVKGKMNKPQIKVNADDLIKKEATKVIKKEVDKYMKEKGQKELEKGVRNLLKGLF